MFKKKLKVLLKALIWLFHRKQSGFENFRAVPNLKVEIFKKG